MKWNVSFGVFAASIALAQAPAGPQFEVASIRPAGSIAAQATSGRLHIGMNIDKARVDIGAMSLAELISRAYDVKPYQVSGPDWMKSQRFDILAKMPDGATKEQVPAMLQALLADRFKLAIHRESKEQSIYALIVAKGGPKLKESPKESPPDTTPPPNPEHSKGAMVIGTEKGPVSVTPNGRGAIVRGGPMGTTRVSMSPNGNVHMEAEKMTMPGLADMLSRFVDRPVVDMTELKGTYDVGLDLSMDDLRNMGRSAGIVVPPRGPDAAKAPGDAASDPSGGSIFAAVQQLGLKLDARKSPLAMIVVDHAEKTPTEN